MSAAASWPALQAVVFDFDGTLFDASDAICHSLNAALTHYGRPALSRAAILPRIGRPLREVFQTLLAGESAAVVQAHVDHYRAAFSPIAVSHTRALPGLQACLRALQQRGLRLGIATSRSEPGARQILAGFGLADAFGALVALEHVRAVKPAPEAVERACAQLGVAPEKALMVGDTPDDMAAGRAAGAGAVGVTTGAHDRTALLAAGAQAVVATLTDLAGLLTAP